MSRSRGIWLFGAAFAGLCAPAAAQVAPNFGSATAYREDPASALARYLRMVTANPRNLEALTGAGNAALKVGDPQAAIGFYARAEAIAPRNGRVKAGLGSALVLLHQEQAALRYFEEAVSLGVPEADIASDRGLAHDLRGSAKRAQRDYGIALRRGADDETTRRLAYSMAIDGDGNGALVLLDPLLRKQDTAAWRARAFILAMTGDAAGANRAAAAVMPASTAADFAPFFRKLPGLRAGEKAAAVHFGHFPGESRPMRIDDLFNQAEVAARVALENTPRSATDAGQVDASQGAFGRLATRSPDQEGQIAARQAPRPIVETRPVATPRSNATSALRPNNDARIAAALTPVPKPVRSAPITALPVRIAEPSPMPAPTPGPTPAPVTTPIASPVASVSRAVTTSPPAAGPGPTPLLPSFGPADRAAQANAGTSTRLADVAATIAPLVQTVELPPSTIPILPAPSTQTVTPATVTTPGPATRLADISSVLAETRTTPAASATVPPAPQPKVEAVVTAVPPPSRPKVETAAAPSATRPAATATTEASRVWVQIASSPDATMLPGEWRRLKRKTPDLLGSQSAWTAPFKATNRLLVGPFATQRDAQDLVNKLKPTGISAVTWTSDEGQAVATLAAR